MKAHEIMIRQVYKVKEYDTVRNFIEKCIEYRISGMPVINDRNEIVAYLSDGDIMRYIGKHDDIVVDSFFQVNVIKGDEDEYEERTRRLLDLNVMAIAKKKVITVNWEEDVERIAAILGKKQIKKVPVERNRVLVGIISRGDVIRHSFKSLL
ncbi:CBS domain-containing protein [Paenibacillus tengchongensis]|uniref:CBS domain-containing protein n=1 Tax=Paenibacillus tengchongensis TaxID=2608684 RepID=UPI00124E78B5|nr:CBS domain-containing protein [Paenibacillus tengchongensis]